MPSILVSPAEPPLIRALGTTAAITEKYGADILWAEPNAGGIVGVQRKEYTDLLNSVDDGRLGKEMAQLRTMVAAPFLVVEGTPHWTTEGTLNHKWLNRWTRADYRSLLRGIQLRGVVVEYTDNQGDTIAYIESLLKWLAKEEHRSLDRRPKNNKTRWGEKTDRSTQSWVLQSIDGIGAKQAEIIIDHFGKVPLTWTVPREELLRIKGIGPKTVDAMTRAIDCSQEVVDELVQV